MISIVRPCKKLLPAVLKVLPDLKNDPTGFQMIHPIQDMLTAHNNHFADYFSRLDQEENGIDLKPEYVPQTTFWIMNKDEYVGTIALRHELTPRLKESGGHIAYQIVPSARNQGVAKQALKLCLIEAQKIGLEKVLITCHEDNQASYKVMHSVMIEMGGHEVAMSQIDGHRNHRVWIMTEKRHAGKIRPLAVAVIRKGNKILANKGYDDIKKQWFWRLPGGGIDFSETAEQTLHREFYEELGLHICVGKQLGVVENIFEFNGKKGHEIIFVFEAQLSDDLMKKDKFPRLEPEFEGEFSEFVEITSDKLIYPIKALEL